MALHHATPGEVIDLSLRPLSAETEHSTAIVKTDEFEAIRLVIPRGTDMLKRHNTLHDSPPFLFYSPAPTNLHPSALLAAKKSRPCLGNSSLPPHQGENHGDYSRSGLSPALSGTLSWLPGMT